MFLTRGVEWKNRIVSSFREADFPEGEQQRGLLAMSALAHPVISLGCGIWSLSWA